MHRIYKQARERDGNKCVKCQTTANLTIHHRLPLATHRHLKHDLSNLLTLCQKCHSEYEKILSKARSYQMILAKSEGRLTEYERLLKGGLPLPMTISIEVNSEQS